jgi:hypothetical protein
MSVFQHILVCAKLADDASGWSAGSEAALELASQMALADRSQVSLLTVVAGEPVSTEIPGKESLDHEMAGNSPSSHQPDPLAGVQCLHADLAARLSESAVVCESLIEQALTVEETLTRQIDQSAADLVIRGWTEAALPGCRQMDLTEADHPLQAQGRTQDCGQDCALWQVQPAVLEQDFPCLAWLDVPGEQALRRLQLIVQLAQVTRSRLLILGPHLPEEGSEPASDDPLLQEFQDRLRQTDFRTLDLGLRMQHLPGNDLPENDPETLARLLADYQVTTLAIPAGFQSCVAPAEAASPVAGETSTALTFWRQLAGHGGYSLLTLP